MSRPAALPPPPEAWWLGQLAAAELPYRVLNNRRLSDRAVRLYGKLTAWHVECTVMRAVPELPAPTELASWLDCPAAAAQRALEELLLAGELEVLDHPAGGVRGQRVSSYRLSP